MQITIAGRLGYTPNYLIDKDNLYYYKFCVYLTTSPTKYNIKCYKNDDTAVVLQKGDLIEITGSLLRKNSRTLIVNTPNAITIKALRYKNDSLNIKNSKALYYSD